MTDATLQLFVDHKVIHDTQSVEVPIMGKKTPPASHLSSLKPLQTTAPAVKQSCNVDCSYEYESLLTRSRLGGSPVLPLPSTRINIEQGHTQTNGHDADWQVLYGLLCVSTHFVLEIVQLKRANFGCRWRNVREADPPSPRCMVGPHWHLMLITWSIFCLLTVLVNVLTFEKAGMIEVGAGIVLSGMCLTCYALVGCTNPGIVTRIDMPLDDTYTYCDHCNSYRPHGALHCMDCRVCIEGYDHHCPWTGKCVGKGNIRYFYAWLLFLILAIVYEVIEFATYLLPPEGQDLLDSSDNSLEIIFPIVTPAPRF